VIVGTVFSAPDRKTDIFKAVSLLAESRLSRNSARCCGRTRKQAARGFERDANTP
jgi:hypothetical protein